MMNFTNLAEELFYKSLLIRRVEEKIIELYPSDCIQSPVHLSIGQEAVAVGVCQALRKHDWVFGSYRGHAFYLAKGGDLNAMMAEFYGKQTGCCSGKGGSMHLAAPEVGFMGCSAVVASTIPHAVGAALAAKFKKQDRIMVAVFGDGATDEGVYHESMNFAALKELPVIMLCENNGLAVHSKMESRQAYDICEHARTYGLKVSKIEEGWDPSLIYEKFQPIADEVRRSGKPHFVEIRTFRYREHVGPGDDFPAGYRDKQECEAWQQRDPLIQRADLVAKFDASIGRLVDAAVKFAEQSPWPGPEQLLCDVY